MRISDWSSDVCSSDLTTLADQLVNRRHEALHLFKLLYRVPVRAKTQKPRRPTGPPGHHTQSAMFKLKKPVQGQRLGCSPTTSPRVAAAIPPDSVQVTGQIGRGSCRDRGCQYVEVLGVAVTIKKKKKTREC